MATIDQILKNNFGLTGKGENFQTKKSNPIKRYNPERFAEAYAVLKADQHKQIAEAAIMRANVMTWKARGEADSVIIDRVKTAGTDLWRTIKMLIGKLVIFFEELIAKFTSKVKAAEKLRDKCADFARKIVSTKRRYVLDDKITFKLPVGGLDTTEIADSEYLPSEFGGMYENTDRDVSDSGYFSMYSDYKGNKRIFNKDGNPKGGEVTDKHRTEISVMDDFMNDATKNLAALKNISFWIAEFAKSAKTKDIKKSLKYIKGRKSKIEDYVNRKGLDSNGRKDLSLRYPVGYDNNTHTPGLNINKGYSSNRVAAEKFTEFIAAGIFLEEEQGKLAQAKKALSRAKKTLWDERTYVLEQPENESPGKRMRVLRNMLVRPLQGCAKYLTNAIVLAQKNTFNYKEIKDVINRIKNAPTSVTGNMKAEDLQFVRTVCTRMTDAMNVARKMQEVALATAIVNISRIYSVIGDVIKRLDAENVGEPKDEDDVVKYRKEKLLNNYNM